MQCSTERLEGIEIWPWRIALRGALLIRDRPKLRALGGPGSAAHHYAPLRYALCCAAPGTRPCIHERATNDLGPILIMLAHDPRLSADEGAKNGASRGRPGL